MGQPHVPTPPVVDQRHGPRAERAALDVVRAVAAPAPLVVDLVEAIFAVGSVAVQLADVLQLVVRVAHQHRVLPALDRLVLVDEVQLGLHLILALAPTPLGLDHQVGLAHAAHHDDTPALSPAGEPQLVFACIPALTDIAPIAARPLPLHQSFDTRALAQLEQVGLANGFARVAQRAARPPAHPDQAHRLPHNRGGARTQETPGGPSHPKRVRRSSRSG